MWDETRETWTIPSMKTSGSTLRERRVSIQGMRRPETEYGRQRKMVDPNLRWHNEDIIDLDITMPARSTPNNQDPNTAPKIASILALDLSDAMEELPSKVGNSVRENQYFRLTDVSITT